MRAIISVVGKDTLGIIAKVSMKCFESGVNILDISQTVMSEFFTMIMLVDISSVEFGKFSSELKALGENLGVSIKIQHEDIFKSMHRV